MGLDMWKRFQTIEALRHSEGSKDIATLIIRAHRNVRIWVWFLQIFALLIRASSRSSLAKDGEYKLIDNLFLFFL